jgi:hypothetical protein
MVAESPLAGLGRHETDLVGAVAVIKATDPLFCPVRGISADKRGSETDIGEWVTGCWPFDSDFKDIPARDGIGMAERR